VYHYLEGTPSTGIKSSGSGLLKIVSYVGGEMAKETYEVKKFDISTGKELPAQFFSSLSQTEAHAQVRKLNAGLTPEEEEKFEFRCCQGNPSHQISMGPTQRPPKVENGK